VFIQLIKRIACIYYVIVMNIWLVARNEANKGNISYIIESLPFSLNENMPVSNIQHYNHLGVYHS
jgi:hypothetical protein